MSGESSKQIIQQLLLMCYMKKKWDFVLPTFQNTIEIVKINYFFNDFKQRRLALSCSKKTIYIIKRNNFKT